MYVHAAATTIHLGVADFVRLLTGDVTPVGAMVARKVRVEGDALLASRLTEMFGGVNPLEV